MGQMLDNFLADHFKAVVVVFVVLIMFSIWGLVRLSDMIWKALLNRREHDQRQVPAYEEKNITEIEGGGNDSARPALSLESKSTGSRAFAKKIVVVILVIIVATVVAELSVPEYADYTLVAKVQEGVNLSKRHRNAINRACSDEAMRIDTGLVSLGSPEAYAGAYVKSVQVRNLNSDSGEVIVVYKAIPPFIEAGQTVIFFAICQNRETQWSVGGSIPEEYLPQVQ